MAPFPFLGDEREEKRAAGAKGAAIVGHAWYKYRNRSARSRDGPQAYLRTLLTPMMPVRNPEMIKIQADLLCRAASEDDLALAELLVGRGVLAAAVGSNGSTALHAAAENSHSRMVRFLMGCGVSREVRDEAGRTPLMVMAKQCGKVLSPDQLTILQLLLPHDADPSVKDLEQRDALWYAVNAKSAGLVKALLQSGASTNEADREGITPLHLAVRQHRKFLTKLLLVHHAKTDIADAAGNFPLHDAARDNSIELVEELLSAGASVDIALPNCSTALHFSVKAGNRVLMILLLRAGASANKPGTNGETAVHLASKPSRATLLEVLIATGGDIEVRDLLGRTPLLIAAAMGSERSIELLHRAGANLGTVDIESRCAVRVAAEADWPEGIRLLGALGLSLGRFDGIAWTPLHWAAYHGKLNVVNALLQEGCPLNTADLWDETPIQLAMRQGHHLVVARLVEHGVESPVDMQTTQNHHKSIWRAGAGRQSVRIRCDRQRHRRIFHAEVDLDELIHNLLSRAS